MKRAVIIGLLALMIFTTGCIKLTDDEPIQNTTTEVPGKPEHFLTCEVLLYKIKRVDSIKSDLCLTTSNLDKESVEAKELNLSMIYAETELNLDEIMLQAENKTCDNINLLGQAFCLKDSSTCLIIGDHNVCSIVKLSDVMINLTVNQTNQTQ